MLLARAPRRNPRFTAARRASTMLLVVAFASFVSVANAVAAGDKAGRPGFDKGQASVTATAVAAPVAPAAPERTERPVKQNSAAAQADRAAAASSTVRAEVVHADRPFDDTDRTITICHENNGVGNYWNSNTVSISSIVRNAGHGADTWDVIPPFDYIERGVDKSYGGKNYGVFTRTGMNDAPNADFSATFTGSTLLNTDGCSYTRPADQCANIPDHQDTIPLGLVRFLGNCVPPPADVCPNLPGDQAAVPIGMHVVGVMCMPDDACANIDGAQLAVPVGHVQNGVNCDVTPPIEIDVCPNLAAVQLLAPPAGLLVNAAGNCVPHGVSCEFDEIRTDDGAAAGTEANDGVIDRCVDAADAICLVDQTPTNRSGGAAREVCVDNPDVTCEIDQTPTNQMGGVSRETCDNDADATCASDQTAQHLVGGPTREACVNHPDATCAAEQAAQNMTGGPTRETCVFVPETCTAFSEIAAVAIDTNGNGNDDTCVRIVPIVDCGVYNVDGSRTLRWSYSNTSGQTLTVTGLRNLHFAGGQPTVFGPSGTFTTTITAGHFVQSWVLTGNRASGFYAASGPFMTKACFPDACPNLAGDQDGVPASLVLNLAGACVPVPPTCANDAKLADADGDGINDTCVQKLDACDAGYTAVDTDRNGVLDACDVNELPACEAGTVRVNGEGDCVAIGTCAAGSTWTDGNGNGIVDVGECIATANAGACAAGDVNRDGRIDAADCAVVPDPKPLTPVPTPDPNAVVPTAAAPAAAVPATDVPAEATPAAAEAGGGNQVEVEETGTGAEAQLEAVQDVVTDTVADVVADDGALPFTGLALGTLFLVGLGFIGTGAALRRTRRREEQIKVDAA